MVRRKVIDPFAPKVALSERLDSLERKHDFMLSRLNTVVDEQVRLRLNDEGFRMFLVDTTKSFIHAHMDDIIRLVVKETILRLNKNIKVELNITKELCYSIDSNIKHTIRDLDCSYDSDKAVERVLDKHISNVLSDNGIVKKLLLDKTIGGDE